MSEIDLDKDIWLPLVRHSTNGVLYFPETDFDDDSFRGCTDLIGEGLVKVFKFNAKSGRIADASFEFAEIVMKPIEDENEGVIPDSEEALIEFLDDNKINYYSEADKARDTLGYWKEWA